MRFICWPFHYHADHPKKIQWCLYSKILNALSVFILWCFCSTNLILIIITHPTSSKRAYICNFLNFSARMLGKKKLNAFCLHRTENKNEKKKFILCTSSNFLQKNYIRKKKTFYNLFSSLLYYFSRCILTCVRFLAHQSVKEKVQRTNSRLFYFEEWERICEMYYSKKNICCVQ